MHNDHLRGAEGKVLGRLWLLHQVLLAIANGAWIVQPSWLAACMEKGQWVEERTHIAQVSLDC